MGEPTKRLNRKECEAKAQECKDLARIAQNAEHRVMLEHMAETWERIGRSVPTNGE